jgi:hypothetical protein
MAAVKITLNSCPYLMGKVPDYGLSTPKMLKFIEQCYLKERELGGKKGKDMEERWDLPEKELNGLAKVVNLGGWEPSLGIPNSGSDSCVGSSSAESNPQPNPQPNSD